MSDGAAADTDAPGEEVPLFPLNTVLFPGGPLPLRIFEARYLDMVSECMRGSRPFGVCLITRGNEAGVPADTVATGTLAEIVDWHQYDDGLLGITALGGSRFRLLERRVAANQLSWARIERLPPEPEQPVGDGHEDLLTLARALVERSGPLYGFCTPAWDSASWVGYRLSVMLPLSPELKQAMLEMEDATLRLDQLADVVRLLAQSQSDE